jgi:hypothetical protein
MSRVFFALIGMAALAFVAARGQSQERRGARNEQAKLVAPGAEHKHLQKLAGEWMLSMNGSTEKGKTSFKSLWDGRFVTEEASLPFGEFTMHWRGIYGYDRHKKKHTAVWIDNMDTNIESAEGSMDAGGHILTLQGQHEDPHTGQPATYRWRITLVDDSKLTIEMLDVDSAGKEKTLMELHGERAK